MIKAGEFEIYVSGPHPCWSEITYRGERLASIHHNELRDLAYVVERATAEAQRRLGEKYKDEVL